MLRTLKQNNSGFQLFFSAFSPDFLKLQYPARNDPDKLCHILNIAPGIACEGMSIANGTILRNPIKFTRYDYHQSSPRQI
ncbi:MAG: hypothetical protein K8F52_14585 [Candidatus Scalindua rubra]|nr:hypothetical protein [Candidatus Scalindua rubra]